MNNGDLIDFIRDRLAAKQPDLLPIVDPVLAEARQEWGGDAVYVKRRPMKEPPKPVDANQ